jgi:hypothetical protein
MAAEGGAHGLSLLPAWFGGLGWLGRCALLAIDTNPAWVDDIEQDARRRDAERFERQLADGVQAGTDLLGTGGSQAISPQSE